ncbi:MAG TPA: alpha-2-macroglobulin family protein, partial [Fimbriimonadaceae bacterium]|nr:alpha-2-macroglobulin family protein [Fimbriimonadaceae bacterium]
TTDIKNDFYPMRSDDVQTNYSFEQIYLDGGDKAGGKVPLRTKFLDTAAWIPSIETGADGIAHTSIKLPDNLTSWRATVLGATDSTELGMTHINFRASKPLSVRLELPSFLVQQDTQTITAIVTNDTGEDQVVNVRLDAQGVTYSGATLQKLTVPAAKPLAVTYNVQTPQSGIADFEARVWVDKGPSDGEKRSVQIEPHGRLRVEDHSGEIKGAGTEVDFTLSKTADQNTGRLVLDISPSIGTAIYQSLDDLIGFPYGCVEQTMSRFLPAVVLSSTLKDLGIRSDLQAKIPDIVSDSFARLANMQHSDGAWGWWQYDGDDRYMTAYVLDGLARAKAAGYRTDKIDVNPALEWAKKDLTDGKIEKWGREDFLFLCYAAAEYGVKKEVETGLARVKPVSGSDFALIALADHAIGDQEGADRALIELHDKARVEGDIAYFPRKDWDFGYDEVAFPLIALTTLMPDDPMIPKLVRYLIADRRGDIWYSTRDSSLALIGMTQYLRQSRDTGQPIDIDLLVNGGAPKRIHFDPADQFNPALKVTIPISRLQPGINRVVFRKVQPEGMCFFSGDLRQVDLAEHLLPEESRGLTVTRTYHLLEPQQMENGSLELRPSLRSIEQAKPGDLIRVELTISSSQDRQFIMIEDPIPSGCRITDREYVDDGEQWANWWTQTIVLDDKAAFFMRYLDKGVQTLSYTMRAEQIGTGHALPPTISNMYDPTESASGAENLLQVGE